MVAKINIKRVIIRWTGPYFIKSSGRKIVNVFYSDGTKGTINYSRILMIEKLGRNLNSEEHVDHKDENKANDSVTNLQILSRGKNVSKSFEDNPTRLKRTVVMNCLFCLTPTIFEMKRIQERQIKNKCAGPFCGLSCAAKFRHANG